MDLGNTLEVDLENTLSNRLRWIWLKLCSGFELSPNYWYITLIPALTGIKTSILGCAKEQTWKILNVPWIQKWLTNVPQKVSSELNLDIAHLKCICTKRH